MKATEKWYEKTGAQNDVVTSTRVRIARNLSAYPFPGKATLQQKEAINDIIKDAFMAGSGLMPAQFDFVELSSLSKTQAVSLVERHIVSPVFISDLRGKAIILSKDESIAIMMNEEDHLRIQVIKEGDSLESCLETADRIDTLLSERLTFAFDENLGYLTQCPTNLGTGMRISFMLHLPLLTEMGMMQRIAGNLSKLGIVIRGSYGEGTKISGNLYQMSNQITLGLTEQEAGQNLHAILEKVIAQERELRVKLSETPQLKDQIYRAAATLKSARLLGDEEFEKVSSLVRLGLYTGHLKGVTQEDIQRLSIQVKPATLAAHVNNMMTEEQQNLRRADLVRETCTGLKEVNNEISI